MSEFIVGLTGGIGSGKSAAADCFRELGIELVDTDILAREVVEPGTTALDAIASRFGGSILKPDASLDRAQLRERIFADPEAREWLEALLHPLINQLIIDRLAACDSPYCLLVSPLLLETRQSELADRVLVIDVSREIQLARTLLRDGSSEQTVEAIIASQIGRKERLARADDVIRNEGDLKELQAAVKAQHLLYLAMLERAPR